MQNSVAKKIFAVGSAAAMLAAFALPMSALAAAHPEGTNVNKSGTVGMIIGGQFRPYTSAGAFLSYGFNSWASVVAASAEDLALPTGEFIPPQDGTVFCATETKGSDVKGECSLVTAGTKAAFTSASVFSGLGFSFSRAQYGDSSFLSKSANVDNTTAAHRTGVLVNNNGTVQLVGASGLLGIPDLATFNSWGYSFANVVPANAADKAMSQTGVMAARMSGQLSPSWTANPNPPSVVSGSVSASLASDNPAGGTIVASSSAVTLAKFAFSGSGTVTQFQVKRIGVSADTVLSNVYLYDGAMRLTDAASVGGSGLVTFTNPNGLFTVSGSKTVSVVAEIAGNATSGQTVGVQLTSFAVASGTPATLAISGNVFTISSVSDLASVDFGTVTPSGSAFDPAPGVEVYHSSISVGTRDVTLSRLAIRQIGSVNYSDVKNFVLRFDGVQVATVAALDANGYASFSFSPVTLKSGTRVLSILADVVGGSSRTFQFQIRNKVDVDFTDTNYGVVISPVDSFPVGSASANDINAGSVTFQKATGSPSGDVINSASNASLAKYTVTAYGEPMKVETLTVGVTSSNASIGSLRNGRVLINGVQYGSTATLSKTTNSAYTTGGTQYTLNYTLQPGTPVTLEIQADVFDNDGTNSIAAGTDTLTGYVVAIASASNVQKMTSLGYITAPASAVAGNALSIVSGSATLNKNNNYSNQTTPLPQSNYKIGSFNLVGSSSEDINITGIDINVSVAGSAASSTLLAYSELNDVIVKVNGNMFGTVKSTLSSATSTYAGNFTLAKNQTVPVEFFATVNLGSAIAGEWIQPSIGVSGTTASSGASVTAAALGQKITYGAGSITAALDGSSPNAAIIADEQTKTAAAFKVTTANDNYTITEVTVGVSAVTSVLNVILKDGNTVLATKPGATSVTFSGLSIPVAPGSAGKVLTVDLQLGVIGSGNGTGNETVTVTLDQFKHLNGNGVLATYTTDVVGNALYAFAAIPTITNVALPATTLAAGTQTLAKFTVSSGGTGEISWNKIIFTVSKTANVGITSNTLSLVNADTNIAITGTMASSTDLTSTGTVSGATVTFTVTGNGGEEKVTSRTYALKGTIGTVGTLTTGDSITVNVAAGQTAHQASATSTAVPQTETFIWSDQYLASHDTTTADWYGDWLVRNIPTDGQTMTK